MYMGANNHCVNKMTSPASGSVIDPDNRPTLGTKKKSASQCARYVVRGDGKGRKYDAEESHDPCHRKRQQQWTQWTGVGFCLDSIHRYLVPIQRSKLWFSLRIAYRMIRGSACGQANQSAECRVLADRQPRRAMFSLSRTP